MDLQAPGRNTGDVRRHVSHPCRENTVANLTLEQFRDLKIRGFPGWMTSSSASGWARGFPARGNAKIQGE